MVATGSHSWHPREAKERNVKNLGNVKCDCQLGMCSVVHLQTCDSNPGQPIRSRAMSHYLRSPPWFLESMHQQDAIVDMYEKLPVPFGLARFGVAPDHPEVKVSHSKPRFNDESTIEDCM